MKEQQRLYTKRPIRQFHVLRSGPHCKIMMHGAGFFEDTEFGRWLAGAWATITGKAKEVGKNLLSAGTKYAQKSIVPGLLNVGKSALSSGVKAITDSVSSGKKVDFSSLGNSILSSAKNEVKTSLLPSLNKTLNKQIKKNVGVITDNTDVGNMIASKLSGLTDSATKDLTSKLGNGLYLPGTTRGSGYRRQPSRAPRQRATKPTKKLTRAQQQILQSVMSGAGLEIM